MSTLETALRGGAVAILLLSVVLRARYARNSPAIAYSALLLVLVERRRQFRLEFAICTAVYIVLVVGSQWIWPGTLDKAPFSVINAFGLIAVTFLFSMLGPSRFAAENPAPDAPQGGPARTANRDLPSATPATAQDTALLAALRRLMEDDKAYRDDGLSIATLSQKLNVQEYRLRRLINGQLGHRNFSAFVNGYRLSEAAAALADPGQAEVPVLTIALDAGFGSIGPFNRAFKVYAGLTPTEYRRVHLGGAEIAAPIPESASHS